MQNFIKVCVYGDKMEHDENCECEECNKLTTDELADQNSVLLDALIELLIEKKVFSEDEFDKKIEEIQKEE